MATVQGVYLALFNRPADPAGLAFWSQETGNGADLAAMLAALSPLPEYSGRFGGMSTAEQVSSIYQSLFNRAPDDAGRDFFVQRIETGQLTLTTLAVNILDGAQGTDAAIVTNKLASADRFSASLDTAQERGAYSGEGAAAAARGFISGIGADPASVPTQTATDAAIATIVASFGGGSKPADDSTFIGDDGKVGIGILDTDAVGAFSLESYDLIGLGRLRADPRFANVDGRGYTVAVLDTGIDLDHPAFGPDANRDGISDRIVAALDFTSENDGTAQDRNDHGSNVSSIVGSSDPRFPGVAPGVNIIHLQVLEADGSGRFAFVERALQWLARNAAAYNVVAANLSLGPGDNVALSAPSPFGLADEFAALRNLGIVTTVATGNDYARYQSAGHSSLAADPNVIGVGAVYARDYGQQQWGGGGVDFTTGADRFTVFGQRSGTLETLMAPGALIQGASANGTSVFQGGTSQAAPQVAGLVAIAQQIAQQTIGRLLTPAEVEQAMRSGAVRIVDGDDESDNVVNTGATYDRVDAVGMANAILALGGGTSPTPPAPPTTGVDDFAGDVTTTGRLALGASATGRIEVSGDRDWFAISLDAGRAYRFSLDGAPSGGLSDPLLVLRDAAGRVVAHDDDGGPGLDSLVEFQASAGGTFYLEARAYGTQTGAYLIAATAAPATGDLPANATTPSVLRPGIPVAGTLDALGDRDWHAIDIVAGRTYDILLQGVGANAGTLRDPLLRLYDGSGNRFAVNDDANGLDSAITLLASATSRIYAEAGAFSDGEAGTYRITVVDRGAGSGDIPGNATTGAVLPAGQTVRSSLEVAGDRDWFRVDLAAGDVVRFALSGDGSAALRDPLLRLYDPGGNLIATNDDSGGTLNSALQFRAERAGTYFAEAAAYADRLTGDYALSLQVLSSGGVVGDVPGNASTSVALVAGTPVRSSLERLGDDDWFRIDADAGDVLRIVLAGDGTNALADPYLRLYDVSGRIVALNDDASGTRNSSLEFTVSQSGTYFASARAFFDYYVGDYVMSLSTSRAAVAPDLPAGPATPAVLSPGAVVASTIDGLGDRDWFAIDLAAGQAVRIALSGSGSSPLADPYLTMFGAAGNVLATNDDGGTGLNSLLDFIAPATGRYFVEARAFANAYIGDYMLSVQGLAAGSAFADVVA